MKHKPESIHSIIANYTLKKQYYSKEETDKLYSIVKPGSHVMLFVSTLTQDIMGVNARLSGFEVRDSILTPAYNANIIVCRKPLSENTVAANTLKWGTGGLNIDASRIEYTSEEDKNTAKPQGKTRILKGWKHEAELEESKPANTAGRFPANIILDETTAGLLDEQSGIQKDGTAVGKNRNNNKHNGGMFNFNQDERTITYGSIGGASRFFYVAKNKKQLLNYIETLITPTNGVCLKIR